MNIVYVNLVLKAVSKLLSKLWGAIQQPIKNKTKNSVDTVPHTLFKAKRVLKGDTMTRREFTKNITSLIAYMISMGEQPIFDFCLRSTEEQQRLYAQGRTLIDNIWVITDKNKVVTFKDGITFLSEHQSGKAMDIYLWNKEKQKVDYEWQQEKAILWHKIWQDKYNGKPMLSFDAPHFAG